MATPYQHDTRGASHAAQIINLERMVEERYAKIERLRADNERLRDAVIDCLSWMQCYCGNPYCGKCRATREADAALAAKGE